MEISEAIDIGLPGSCIYLATKERQGWGWAPKRTYYGRQSGTHAGTIASWIRNFEKVDPASKGSWESPTFPPAVM